MGKKFLKAAAFHFRAEYIQKWNRQGSVANWDMASIQPEVAKQNDDLAGNKSKHMDDAKEIFSSRTLSIPPFSYITDEILDEFLVALLHLLVR